jgi:SPFH domain / Band 7 family
VKHSIAIAFIALATISEPAFADKTIVDVGASEILVVISREGADLGKGEIFASSSQKGIRNRVFTAGRYELDSDVEQWEKHPLVDIGAGRIDTDGKFVEYPQVGVVTALVGEPVPDGQILAEEGQRGIQRRVLTPGNYALNPYAFNVELRPATIVMPGHVGVVTRLVGDLTVNEFAETNERGIQRAVLAPGIYYLNPYEISVTPIRVGYRELTFEGEQQITFPSADSYPIEVETTVVWGILPSDAPHLVKRYGSEPNLIDRVLRPQVEYHVRTAGSDLTAKEFVDGSARERFQQRIQDDLAKALIAKHIRVQLALVRTIVVPESVRKPIQVSKIAEEETLTNQTREKTITAHTELVEVTSRQQLVVAEAKGETERIVAEERARGDAELAKARAEFELERGRYVAEISSQKQEIDDLVNVAKAEAQRRLAAARATAETKRIALFGSSEAYSAWRFATGLSTDLKFELRSDPPPAPGRP